MVPSNNRRNSRRLHKRRPLQCPPTEPSSASRGEGIICSRFEPPVPQGQAVRPAPPTPARRDHGERSTSEVDPTCVTRGLPTLPKRRKIFGHPAVRADDLLALPVRRRNLTPSPAAATL